MNIASLTDWMAEVIFAPSVAIHRIKIDPPRPIRFLGPLFLLLLVATWSDLMMEPAGEASARRFAMLIAHLCGLFWIGIILWSLCRFVLGRRIKFGQALELAGAAGVLIAAGILLALPFRMGGSSEMISGWKSPDLFTVWVALILGRGLAILAEVPYAITTFWVGFFWIALPILLTRP